jgi:carbonic anhydrase/acetyltransferase-like protein (isoleucine patch superfamily)
MPQNPLILPYDGISPSFGSAPLHAGAGAAVLGRVTLGENCWLGALSLMRADGHVVQVGDDFHLGPRSTLHIAHEVFPCLVGDRVTIGENSCVHACTVGNDVVVGDNVVILDGATVEDNVVFEAGATVFPGKRVTGGHVYAGSPAKPVRPLAPNEISERRATMQRVHAKSDSTIPPRQAPARESQIDPSVFIASTATIKGRLRAAPSSSIFFSNDFDAGDAVISIGEKTNIQDNTIIRCSTAQGFSIGRDSTIGHNVLLHDCSIGDESLIGIGSVVAGGTIVGDRVLLAASARTIPGQELESGWLYAGNPARKLSPLDKSKQHMIAFTIWTYCQYSQAFKAAESALLQPAI